jgi:hypothetical protein
MKKVDHVGGAISVPEDVMRVIRWDMHNHKPKELAEKVGRTKWPRP